MIEDRCFAGNAIVGSAKLRDAIFKAAGYTPRPVARKTKPKRRKRGKPLGWRMKRTVNPKIILIQAEVARYFGISRSDLMSRDRRWEFSRPRQVAMFLARETGASLPEVGWHFNRDHSTILHAHRAVPQRTDLWLALKEIPKLLTDGYPDLLNIGDKSQIMSKSLGRLW
jgi:hypothetical protein